MKKLNPGLFFIAALTLLSCGKNGDHTTPSGDTAKPVVFKPYDSVYSGAYMAHSHQDNGFIIDFDTAYTATFVVTHLDTNNLRFNFESWDFKTDTGGKQVISRSSGTFQHAKLEGGRYVVDSGRHYKTVFTLRGDSLLVQTYQYNGTITFYHSADFAGKRR